MSNKETKINIGEIKKGRVISLVFSFLILFFLAFSIWLCFSKVRETSNKIFSTRSEISLSEIQIKEVEQFKAKYQYYLPNLKRIDEAMVDPQNPLDFIRFLENFADNYNVDLTISPLVFSEEQNFKTASVKFTAKGNFSNVLYFIKEIESGAYLVLFKNLTIEYVDERISGSGNSVKKTKASATISVLSK